MNFGGRYADHLHPDKLDTVSVSIFLDTLHNAHGGVGANIAYTLALLGHQPILLGSAGHDARIYLEQLAHTGVNITHVHESKLPTASFNVITDSDQNQIGGFYPGAMFDSASLSLEPWRHQNPLVVVAPHDPEAMRRQVEQCRSWGLKLCYDVGQQVSNLSADDLHAGVAAAHILILNDYELTALSHKTGLSIPHLKSTVPLLVTTLGKDGSRLEGASLPQPITIGVVKPNQIADPTGAGDAYRSGFLYGYLRDWPLTACAQLGATTAAYAVETVGTQGHRFTPAQITKRYQDTFHAPLPTPLI